MPLNQTLITLFEILYLLTVVSIVVVVITENRNPIKTVAWVLAVLFLPVIGIIWYAIFGQDTTRKHVISRRMYSKLKKRPLDEMETPVEQSYPEGYGNLVNLLRRMDYNPLLGGNEVELFTHASVKFERLFADIRRPAATYISKYYVLEDDDLGKAAARMP